MPRLRRLEGVEPLRVDGVAKDHRGESDTAGGKRGCGNEREDLGKLFDPRWGLQGGSKSFPDPPGGRLGCSEADGGGKGHRGPVLQARLKLWFCVCLAL